MPSPLDACRSKSETVGCQCVTNPYRVSRGRAGPERKMRKGHVAAKTQPIAIPFGMTGPNLLGGG